jgi:hypothetical protein
MNPKIPLILRGALCALAFCSYHLQAAPAGAADSSARLDIELQDDSRLVGKSPDDMLRFHSAALGDMQLPWAGIRSIENPRGADTLQILGTNGDSIAVQFPSNILHLETDFGPTDLPVKLIRSVKVTPPPARKPAPGSASSNESGWRLFIDLRDGARVVAKGLADTLSFHSLAMGELKLTWAGIRSIEFAETNADTAHLTATNGDVYEVQFSILSLGMETGFGKTELPVKQIHSIQVIPLAAFGDLPSSLVARWRGDGNAKDSFGHADGQVSSGLSYVQGPGGQAFQFDGGSSKVDFGNSAGNFGTNDFTVAFWIKTSSKNGHEAFFSKRASCDAGASAWDIQIGGGQQKPPPGCVVMGLWQGGGKAPNEIISHHPLNDGYWHHVACVRQTGFPGGVTGLLYIDGALDVSTSFPEAVNLSNQTPLVLGQSVCQGRDNCSAYSGAAADLQLFSQALSAEEILAIYLNGKGSL